VVVKADIVITQGDTFSRTVIVYDANGWPAVLTDDGTLTGDPFTATAQLRRDYADTDTTVDATFGCTVQPVGSRVTIALNTTQTTALVPTINYRYDVQVTNPTTTERVTVALGRAFVQGEVTR
jgi:hypothetical protein